MLATNISEHAVRLRKSQLAAAIAVAIGTATTAMVNVAIAEPNVTVYKTIEKSNTSPASVCLTMSAMQAVDPNFSNLSKNVKVSSRNQPVDAPVSVVKGDLCIGGLEAGKTYNVLLKKGLQFTSGTKLDEAVNHSVTISDSIAQIKLPYNIILPKNGSVDSFTVKTVNQPAFKLSIYRIPETVLDDFYFSDLSDSNFSLYRASSFLTNLGRPVYERIFDISNNDTLDIFAAQQSLKQANDQGVALVSEDGSTPEEALKAQIDKAKKARVTDELRNKTQSTDIKLKDFMASAEHGMYLIVAADPRIDYTEGFDYDDISNSSLPLTAKMMVITDLGVTTYKANDGILVNVRSITSAKALKDVKLTLQARNGEVLAQATTDKDGTARFAKEFVTGKGALAAAKITAETKSDYFVQDLFDKALFLEDNKGATSNNTYEVYAYTDRGIYRPKETVHYTALLRDKQLKALDLPLTLKIENAHGSELSSVLLNDSSMGGYAFDFAIPEGTVNGRYTANLYLGDKRLEQTAFTIGSYVPTQINTEIVNNEGIFPVNTPFKLKSATKFNYGGIASNLSGKFRMVLRPDEHPVPATANAANNAFLKQFHFGPDKSKYTELSQTELYTDLKSDAEGVISKEIKLSAKDYPQKATASASVFDTSGQEVKATKTFKVAFNNPLLGIRRIDDVKSSSDKAAFTLCSYLQDGSTYPQDAKYFIFKEFTDYNFVYEDGAWRYVVFKSRNLVTQGQVKVDNQSLDKALITADLEDGSYVLEVESAKSKSSLSFVKGFSSSMNDQTPDRVALFTDKESYNPGEELKLSFDSPFDGYANLAIGSEGINEFETFKVSRGHNEYTLKVSEDLYPQGHALLSLFSPLEEDGMGVIRTVGLVDINMNADVHKLNVKTTASDEIKPGKPLTININALPADLKDGETAFDSNVTPPAYARVTLVDQGILSLTNYKAPNPNKVFMQDRAYNIDLFDSYSMLIRDPKQQGQGYGDGADEMMANASGATSLDTVSFKTVALASEVVPLDQNGNAQVTFDIPKFAGSLKYMTVAWDETRTGADESNVLVRDNAVSTIGLPRYLNVGDTVTARLNLHNLKAKNPDFKIDVSCDGALKCSMQSVRSLKPGIREDNYFDVTAVSEGVGNINLTVINPDYKYTDSYPLQVTYPQMSMLKSFVAPVDAQKVASVDIGNSFIAIDDVLINLSALPFVNPVALTAELDKGWDTSLSGLAAELESKLLYGSTLVADEANKKAIEEATSSEEVRKLTKPYANEAQLNSKIEEIIFRMLARQKSSGSFYSWNDYDAIYAAEMLIKAADAGHNVNADALERAIKFVRNVSSSSNECAPYALSILSRFESINQADVRFMLDDGRVSKPVLLGHLAVTLNNIGDQQRAKQALNQAIDGLKRLQSTTDKLATLKNPFTSAGFNLVNEIDELQVEGQYNIRKAAFTVIKAAIEIGDREAVSDILDSMHSLKQAPDFISATEASAKLSADFAVTGADNIVSGKRAVLSSDETKALLSTKAASTGSTTATAKDAAAKDKAAAKNSAAKDTAASGTKDAAGNSQAISMDESQLYAIKDGKLLINNSTGTNLFANVTVLGQYKHDKIISNKGFYTKVNLFNRDGAIKSDTYEFQTNEEVLMEIFVDAKVASSDDIIIKTKIPAGFEFVRRMKHDDPSFADLFEDEDSYDLIKDIRDFAHSDDTIAATYRRDDVGNSFSLFVVLRAAHPGKFTQGESMVQLKSDPGYYGTFMTDSKLKIANPSK